MDVKKITDMQTIKEFLFKDPYLHLYEIGNLQEKLFHHITWHAAVDAGVIKAVSMLYISEKHSQPIFFLLENTDMKAAAAIIEAVKEELPDNFYAHISKSLSAGLKDKYETSQPHMYDKMKLTGDILLDKNIIYPEHTFRINANDFETVNELLRGVNPSAFFVPAMLKTGKYFCVRKNAELMSMAGVHFYSTDLGIAAIGNVMTLPQHRGKGYAASVTASLCRDLWKEVKYIGLNVRSDNTTAIKVYTRMGFQYHSTHEEITAVKKA